VTLHDSTHAYSDPGRLPQTYAAEVTLSPTATPSPAPMRVSASVDPAGTAGIPGPAGTPDPTSTPPGGYGSEPGGTVAAHTSTPPAVGATPPGRAPQRALHKHADIGPLRGQGGADTDHFDQLAMLAESENWAGRGTTAQDPTWTLREYIEWTFERLSQQRKVLNSPEGAYSVFNSGLATRQQEPIYGLFTPNRNPDGPPWQLTGWFPESERGLHEHFAELPAFASYAEDPAELVFDWRLDIVANPKLLLESQENLVALPDPLRDNPYQASLVLEGAIRRAEARVRRSYRTAVPCWDPATERVQLLLPLSLTNPETVDVALVVSREGEGYRGHTVLGLDVAYARARQLARPEEWLSIS
jgi:Domain of unknown function (DUF3825)